MKKLITQRTLEKIAIKIYKLHNRGVLDKKSRDIIIDLLDKAMKTEDGFTTVELPEPKHPKKK